MVLEQVGVLGRLEVDCSGLADSQLTAVVAADVDRRREALADRAGAFQPLLCFHRAHPVALGARVVLQDDRSPPLDHPALDIHRAGRGGMDRPLVAGQVVARPRFPGQLEHPVEHRGDPLADVDPMVLDRLERQLRVEPLQDHDGAAERLGAPAEANWRRVVERRGRQVDRIGIDAVDARQHLEPLVWHLLHRQSRKRPQDALRPPRRARAVQHRAAARLLGKRFGRVPHRRLTVVIPARGDAEPVVVDHQAAGAGRNQVGKLSADLGQLRRRNDSRRSAVLDDVRRFFGRQVAVHRGQVETRTDRRPVDLEVARVVLHEDRHVVAGPQALRVPELCQPVRPSIELQVADRLASAGHDHRRLVRRLARVSAGIHRDSLAYRSLCLRLRSPPAPSAN